jgi:DNA-binding NarL/FixJ family response regulator
MSTADVEAVPGLPSDTLRGWRRRTVAGDKYQLPKRERMEVQLLEALAREEALLFQKQELMQKQIMLTRLFGGPEDVAQRVARMTSRERQIMELVLAGHPNKNIAADLGINQRTVENHRAAIMRKTNSKSFSALIRFALAAALNGGSMPVALKVGQNDK